MRWSGKTVSNGVGKPRRIPKMHSEQCFCGKKSPPTEYPNTGGILRRRQHATQTCVLSPSLCVSSTRAAAGPGPRHLHDGEAGPWRRRGSIAVVGGGEA